MQGKRTPNLREEYVEMIGRFSEDQDQRRPGASIAECLHTALCGLLLSFKSIRNMPRCRKSKVKLSSNTHTHTPCPPLIIGSSQRIVASEARHVEVVFNDHDVSHFEVLIKASGCVGQHHRLHAEQLEDAYGQRNLGTQHGI